ncbi:hypothetical protein F5884DRAFT_864987 [Xylogone sp. PMI_703]|nr:hypothetical protein F5884DRAFT_864987 [Xylogone sp. PMI_703]
MLASGVPVYFEESWAILSSIGLINLLLGLIVAGIASLCPATLVPIVTSAAGALANGLCYYAFYTNNVTKGTAVAAGVADTSWLIQEVGMSFYSYLILIRILNHKERMVFMLTFWALILAPVAFRLAILQARVQDLMGDNLSKQPLVDNLHVGYFISIAALECLSAFFLLRRFTTAKKICCKEAPETRSLFRYLTRSTEIRVSVLAVIGFSRAITYSFQTQQIAATSPVTQLDRFVYTLECMFPVIMYIDILAPKYILSSTSNGNNEPPFRNYRNSPTHLSRYMNDSPKSQMYSISHLETRIDANGLVRLVSSSQERILQVPELARTNVNGQKIY